jgi:hypothetical protein
MFSTQNFQAGTLVVYTLNPDIYISAMIDEHGKEIPITDEMVRSACAALEDEFYPGRAHQKYERN